VVDVRHELFPRPRRVDAILAVDVDARVVLGGGPLFAPFAVRCDGDVRRVFEFALFAAWARGGGGGGFLVEEGVAAAMRVEVFLDDFLGGFAGGMLAVSR
jgi:hypothetical protein